MDSVEMPHVQRLFPHLAFLAEWLVRLQEITDPESKNPAVLARSLNQRQLDLEQVTEFWHALKQEVLGLSEAMIAKDREGFSAILDRYHNSNAVFVNERVRTTALLVTGTARLLDEMIEAGEKESLLAMLGTFLADDLESVLHAAHLWDWLLDEYSPLSAMVRDPFAMQAGEGASYMLSENADFDECVASARWVEAQILPAVMRELTEYYRQLGGTREMLDAFRNQPKSGPESVKRR